MSVRVPISADPSGAVSAFDQITNAIRRAGQEGRQYSELDFSHPELKNLEADLRKVQQNFEELQKVGRGQTAAAVRAGKYTDVLDWYRRSGRQFPDAAARAKHRATVGSYVAQGTGMESEAPEAPGGGAPAGGFGGAAVPGIGRFIKGALGLAGIAGLASLAHQGVESAQQEAIQLDFFKRSINDTDDSFGSLRSRIEKAGEGLQLTYQETVKLARGFAQASALQSGASIARGVNLSAGFARSFGMELGQTGGMFGQMRFRGVTGPGGMDPKQFALMMADAISAGGMFAKSNEVMQAVAHYVTSSERVMVNAPNVRDYTDLLTRMNYAGKNGMPGLRGDAGAALIAQVDAAIRSGGRFGDAGQNIIWRALNTGRKHPLDPFQAKWLEAGGAFGTPAQAFKSIAPGLAHGHKTNLDAILDEMRQRFSGRSVAMRAEATGNVLGVGIRQAQALFALQHQHGGGLGGIGALLKNAGLTFKDLNPTGLKELGQIAYGDTDKLAGLKKQFLGRSDLTDQEMRSIHNAKKPEALRAALAQAAAHHGRIKNQGTEIQNSITNLQNAITHVGTQLLDPIKDIRAEVAQIASRFGGENPLTDAWNATFGKGGRRKEAQSNLKGAAKEIGKDLLNNIEHPHLLPRSFREKYGPMLPLPASLSGRAPAPGDKPKIDVEVVLKNDRGEVLHVETHETTLPVPSAHSGT